jgi:plastocyanin
MLRRLLLPFALVGACFGASLAAAAAGNAATAKSSGLVGESGPGYSIEVKLNGKDLKTIKAGTYRIKVEDKSSIHNFHLIGKGVNKSTTIAFTGDRTWKVTFKPGKVTYQCDAHASLGMKGSFRVTS